MDAPALTRAGVLEVWQTGSAAPAAFPKHSHDEMVISANLSGGERLWLDGRTYEAGPGDVTLYMPGAVQASRSLGDQPWQFVTLYAPPDWLEQVTQNQVQVRRAVAAAPQSLAFFRTLAGLRHPGRVEETALLLLESLGDLLEFGPHRGLASPPRAPLSAFIDRLCAFDLPVPTLGELAELAGLSPTGLVRAFRRTHGLPPLAWALDRRLIEARRRLRGAESLAAIALDLGFADQAHFTRAFRKVSGLTPGAYRKRASTVC